MVEKIELAIVFITRHPSDEIIEYTPVRVIEGTFDKDNNWFNDTTDGVTYLHIDVPSPTNVGYACRQQLKL